MVRLSVWLPGLMLLGQVLLGSSARAQGTGYVRPVCNGYFCTQDNCCCPPGGSQLPAPIIPGPMYGQPGMSQPSYPGSSYPTLNPPAMNGTGTGNIGSGNAGSMNNGSGSSGENPQTQGSQNGLSGQANDLLNEASTDGNNPVSTNNDEFDPTEAAAFERSIGGGTGGDVANFNPMIGDFFINSSSQPVFIPLIFSYDDVAGQVLGGGGLGFDVGGSAALDIFTTGPFDSNIPGFQLAEILPPTAADLPTLPGYEFAGGQAVQDGNLYDLVYGYVRGELLPAKNLAGRQKIAANVSPIPRTRWFVDYSYFNNTPMLGGTNVHRMTPGFEYAYNDSHTSIEVRVPMAITANSRVFLEDLDKSNYEFGNLFLAYKGVIYESRNSILSLGVSFTLPTENDLEVFRSNSRGVRKKIIELENESVHVMPFLGYYFQKNDWILQGFLQMDIDVNGSPIYTDFNDRDASQLVEVGKFQDTPLLYFDIQLAKWLVRKQRMAGCSCREGLTGLAPLVELHYNRSLQANDVITQRDRTVGGNILFQYPTPAEDVQILNSVVGLTAEFNYSWQWTLGYATPIGNGADAQFDGELRVALNRLY